MKKTFGFLLIVSVACFTLAAWAELPSITKSSVINRGLDTAKNKVIEDDINKKVAAYNCMFKKGKDTETTCDLDKVFGTINSKKAPFEALGLASVYVRVKANNYNRAHYVEQFGEGSLGNWWKISSTTNSTMGDKIEITVKSY